jgi:hypothetical protein
MAWERATHVSDRFKHSWLQNVPNSTGQPRRSHAGHRTGLTPEAPLGDPQL